MTVDLSADERIRLALSIAHREGHKTSLCEDTARLLGKDGLLAQSDPQFSPREAQLRMSEAVATNLENGGVALIEAGTGTGKTLGYLVPSILSGKRVVISTATHALQDQILKKDIPILERALGRPIRVALLKGLSSYICMRRLDDAGWLDTSEEESLDIKISSNDSTFAQSIRSMVQQDGSGMLSEIRGLPDHHSLRTKIASSYETRIGSRCRFYDRCFVTKARAEAAKAEILIVNHHLFFSDLQARESSGGFGVGVLPEYEAVIFDEAHHLADVATQFFGVTLSLGKIEATLHDLERSYTLLSKRERIEGLARDAAIAASDLFTALRIHSLQTRGADSRTTIDATFVHEHLQTHLFQLDISLERIEERCGEDAGLQPTFAQWARRVSQLRSTAAEFLPEALNHDNESIAWATIEDRSIRLEKQPIDVGPLFASRVLKPIPHVVLTSATLTEKPGSFEFAKKRLGISECLELHVDSPFDLARQAILYAPKIDDPRSSAWNEQVRRETEDLIQRTKGGAFVLSTSFRMMNELSRTVRLPQGTLRLVQGEASKHELLDRFRKDGNAVLFATQSFWEGVDVRGHALRLVIIDKLPFDVPSDPLVQARCKRIEDEGESAFMKYLLPQAILALRQGVGRLVRTHEDHGIVAILDGRLHQKGYGKLVLKSLMPMVQANTSFELDERMREQLVNSD